jgi:peptide/nickel transport system substrate-binding protein
LCDASDPNAAPWCKSHPGTGNPALLDLNVRTAIAMAIDKQALVTRVLEGYGTPGDSVVVPGATFWHWNPGADAIPFDIPGANQLLDQSGYTDTNNDGIRNDPKTGDDLQFRMILRSDSPDTTAMGQLIVGWVKQIGIQLMPISYTDGKLIDAWTANDYDTYIWGWGPDPDPDFILSTYTAGQCGSWSDTCYSNPTLNQLYDKQRTTIDPNARKAIIVQMQQIIYEQVPEIVLEYGNDLQAWRSDRWTGFVYQPKPDSRGWGGSVLYQYYPSSPAGEYIPIRPVSAEAGTVKASGVPPWVWGLAIGVILVIVAGVMLARHSQPEEEQA